MSMMQTTFPTKEVATILGMAVKNVIQRAERESWQFAPRPGKGGGKLWVRDNKDDSMVAFVHKGKRALEHTQKMGETMTAALNAAVSVSGKGE